MGKVLQVRRVAMLRRTILAVEWVRFGLKRYCVILGSIKQINRYDTRP